MSNSPNWIQREEEREHYAEIDYARRLFLTSKAWLSSEPAPRPVQSSDAPSRSSAQLPLYAIEEAQPCEDCGGRGYDPGSIDPQGERCRTCQGSGIEYTTRLIPMKPVQSTPQRKREEVA